jgi:hypothetical protein
LGLVRSVVICGRVQWRKPFEYVLFYLCPWRGFSLDGRRDTGKRSQTLYFLNVALYLPYIVLYFHHIVLYFHHIVLYFHHIALYFHHIALYFHHIALNFLDIVQYLLSNYVGFVGT